MTRTLRSFVEATMGDLISWPLVKFAKHTDDGAEFDAPIGDLTFTFRIEPPSDDDPRKPLGLLGVMDSDGGSVDGPIDQVTWDKINSFVRRRILGVMGDTEHGHRAEPG